MTERKIDLPNERQLMKDLFHEVCETHKEWKKLPYNLREEKVRRMERSCVRATVEYCESRKITCSFVNNFFVNKYSEYCYLMLANLEKTSPVGSNYFIKNLISNEINPYNVAKLTSIDLCPDASKKIRDDIEERSNQKFDMKVSTTHTCRKCKNNKTIRMEYQARAGDEASSFSIKCINCGHVWRS